MSCLLAVDPGTHHLGLAIFSGRELLLAYLERGRPTLLDMPITQIVIEIPQIYTRTHSKADPKDLIRVAYAAGRATVLAPHAEVRLVHPRAWKGSTKKHITEGRVLAELTPEELARIMMPPRSLANNVFDSVAIGLRTVGRLGHTTPTMERAPL